MSNVKADVKLVVRDEKKGYSDLYIKDALCYYPVVHEPKLKYKTATNEKEYTITLFVDPEAKEALEDLNLNKEFKLVGKDKNKKRAIKYPLDKYPEAEGLYGAAFTLPAKAKNGNARKPIVVWGKGNNAADVLGEAKEAGEICETNIGNGSIVSMKLGTYKNEDGLLNTSINTIVVTTLVPFTGGSSGVVQDDEFGFAIDYNQATAKSSKAAEEAEMFGDDDVY